MSDHQLHGQFTQCLTPSSAPSCHCAQAFPLSISDFTFIYTKGNPPSFCSLCFMTTLCVPHQQPFILLHLLLYFSLACSVAECSEEQERLTPNKNIIQHDDLQQRERENMFTIFSFATLRLTQTFQKPFCCVLCMARQSCCHLWGCIQSRECVKITEVIQRMERWV